MFEHAVKINHVQGGCTTTVSLQVPRLTRVLGRGTAGRSVSEIFSTRLACDWQVPAPGTLLYRICMACNKSM